MANTTEKIKNYKSKFKFDEENLDYLIQLKKKNRKWLWLLLLFLPLLLFVKCSKNIAVQTLDENGNICPYTKVSLAYTARFSYDNKSFFVNEPYHAIQTTDANGITTFKGIRYSVFSSIFYINSKAFISARSECYAKDTTLLFHFIRSKKTIILKMNAIRTDVQLKVIDAKLKSSLENATVYYEYTEKDKVYKDSLISDANGYVTIPNIPKCHVLDLIQTSKIDYLPDVRKNASVNELFNDEKKNIIPLEPINKCAGTWIIKLDGKGDRKEKTEFECILKDGKATIFYPHPDGILDEKYQCDGDKLTISWKVRNDMSCTYKLIGRVKDGIYKGNFEHIDVNGGRTYNRDKGPFTGRLK